MDRRACRSSRASARGKSFSVNRRHFLKLGAAAGAGVFLLGYQGQRRVFAAPVPGGTLDPAAIPKYVAPLVIPPAMPSCGKVARGRHQVDYYEIAVRQFQQQILPPGMPATTVWSYGSARHPGTVGEGGSFNYPAFTIEAKWNQRVRVKWINGLVDDAGGFLPHLLPVDQTIHWANPPGPRDTRGTNPARYQGPVPIVTHVHGGHTFQESDGYPEAWFLPAANNIPADVQFTTGTYYDIFKDSSPTGGSWSAGTAVFDYPNDQRAATLWYHDHTLGMTRVNVYAGPAGFYLIRGGPDDRVLDGSGKPAKLPGPAPALGDAPGKTYYEIPIVIQDRSFNADGSLFYPDNRAFFEGLEPQQLQIPFIPEKACAGQPSDVSPIWQPEFFANVMVVNGVSWPFLEVEPRRYRFRLLNGCDSRFLILSIDHPGAEFWQIGADGGFLAAPVDLRAVSGGMLLLGPAERADVIVDFSKVPDGSDLLMLNRGPDEPFGGGQPGVDFPLPDAGTTAQVMQFRVRKKSDAPDPTTPPAQLQLPAVAPPQETLVTRQLSLNEDVSKTVLVKEDANGNVVLACEDPNAVPFGPTAVLLGTLNADGTGHPLLWSSAVTENPTEGTRETWEIYNFTVDSHPIHIHQVQFQVMDRRPFGRVARPPEPGETGFKDTVIALPNEITRVQALFDIPGRFVWHCHIIEHEDNEMMRPYDVLPNPDVPPPEPPHQKPPAQKSSVQKWGNRESAVQK